VLDGSGGFGPQAMMGMGRQALDAWWEMLLQNRERLEQLAQQLNGLHPASDGAGVGSHDLASVVEALTLVETRLDDLDEQVTTLAEGMADLVRHLEGARGERKTGDG
jgi:hypothetical protein